MRIIYGLIFFPHMKVVLDWKPDKKLLQNELSALNGKNYKKMINVANQNIFYMTESIHFLINKIVNNEVIRNKFFKTTMITNSCCLENIFEYEPYYKYFIKKDSSIATILMN